MFNTSTAYYPSPSTGITQVTYNSRIPHDSPAMIKAKASYMTNANTRMIRFC